ncbi:MAG: peptidoglycan D,D-transpeptidase FtsI family protein [Actinomycetota bacterium]
MAFVLLFALMGSRLFVLQIVESDRFQAIAAAQRQTVVEFPARRGAILDRDGDTLAISVDTQMVVADPSMIEDPLGTAQKLAPVLGLKPNPVARSLQGSAPTDRFEYVARQVEPAVAKRVKRLGLAGVFLRDDPKRVYPNGRVASHLLGFVNIDGSVKEGIEAQYDEVLEGSPGRMSLERDPSGRPLPQAEYSYERPTPGRSLLLTVDKDIQYFTELTLADAVRRYRAASGTAIVVRPNTGEILALANVPNFDPNRYGESHADERRNRALTDVYEPGSVFKIVTASAALAEGVVTPNTTYVVPDELPVADRVIHDSHYHETEAMSVTRIIKESSNVGTVKIGLDLGERRLSAYLRKFGFGVRTGLDFPGESSGIVPPVEYWSGSSIANIPIGQGIAVTPIQMLSAYATIANNGVWVEPKLLRGSVDGEGGALGSAPPTRRRVVPRSAARQVTEILRGVVVEGTGTEAQIPGYDVAGKTGTAQKVKDGEYVDRYFASFAGYAPAKHAQIAAIVVLDEPTPIWGGSTAAPTFKLIMQRALRELGVAPTLDAERSAEAIAEDRDNELSTQD